MGVAMGKLTMSYAPRARVIAKRTSVVDFTTIHRHGTHRVGDSGSREILHSVVPYKPTMGPCPECGDAWCGAGPEDAPAINYGRGGSGPESSSRKAGYTQRYMAHPTEPGKLVLERVGKVRDYRITDVEVV